MNADFGSHFPEELFETYAMGQLSVQDGAPLEEHLLICPACQTRLSSIDEYIAIMRAAAYYCQSNVPPLAKRARQSELHMCC